MDPVDPVEPHASFVPGPVRRPRRFAILLLAACVACRPEPDSPPEPPAPAERPVRMPSVVSLSPTASAVLIEIGAAAALIAVDAESHALPDLAELPVVDLAGSGAFGPELVVVPALTESDFAQVRVLRERGSDVLEFAPHNFDDAYADCQQLGQRVGRQARTHTWVRDHAREMAVMSAKSFGYQRPRVAAVINWAPLATGRGPGARERALAGDGEPRENAPPLVVAGGHSFVTDLIEIAGAESVTHGTEIFRVPMTEAELWATRPDLVLVISPESLPEDERGALRARLAGPAEIAFLAFDSERFWLKDALPIARRVRELVAPLVRGPLEQPPPFGAPGARGRESPGADAEDRPVAPQGPHSAAPA